MTQPSQLSDGSPSTAESEPPRVPTSSIIRSLAGRNEAIAVRDLLSMMGLRAHGFLILILALPDAVPLPVPSVSAIVGLPLVLVASHLVVFGENGGVPHRVSTAKIPKQLMQFLARYAAPVLQVLESLSRPRLHFMLKSDRAIGVVCLLLALMLLMPIPFLNFPPALCLAVIALGMVQRDGLLVLTGLAIAAFMAFALRFAADWLIAFFR
jgi:hypothetical protein